MEWSTFAPSLRKLDMQEIDGYKTENVNHALQTTAKVLIGDIRISPAKSFPENLKIKHSWVIHGHSCVDLL